MAGESMVPCSQGVASVTIITSLPFLCEVDCAVSKCPVARAPSLFSGPLYIPPPLLFFVLQLRERPAPTGSAHSSPPPSSKRISGLFTFSLKSSSEHPIFFFILDLFWSVTLPVVRRVGGVCLACVWFACGSVYQGSGVVLFAPRESLKVVTGGDKKVFQHHECPAAAPVGPGRPFLRLHTCKPHRDPCRALQRAVLVTEQYVPAAPTEAAQDEPTVVTGPPAIEPPAAPAEVTSSSPVEATEAATEAAAEAATEAATEAAAEAATEAATEAESEEITESITVPTVITEEPVLETEAPTAAAEAPEPLATDAPAVETAAPTEAAEVEPVATAAAEAVTEGDVVVVDDTEEGMSSGQVAGIVIGSLLAVVIVIAVMTAACRRMGKYSP
ncbi:unnamed protein product [Pleuronectes platessa]|uniref:Uncharacterized protein n=1 Tax=Pleuronectes platessa TaxID=8262 RepID=A0A9N7TYN9_PLEPL|nr:unnamed protein product [Pleuronectes platessa]